MSAPTPAAAPPATAPDAAAPAGPPAWPVEVCGGPREGGAPSLRVRACGCGETIACTVTTVAGRHVLGVKATAGTGARCRACVLSERVACAIEGRLPSPRAWLWVNGAIPIVVATDRRGEPRTSCRKAPLPSKLAAFGTAPIVAVLEATAVQHECSGAGGTHAAMTPREVLRGPGFRAAVIGGHARHLDVQTGDLLLAALEPVEPPKPSGASPGWCIQGLPASDARVIASVAVPSVDSAVRLLPSLAGLAEGSGTPEPE